MPAVCTRLPVRGVRWERGVPRAR